MEKNPRICPVEMAGGLDNSFRRLLQHPRKILQPYVKKGMIVLDVGCGPGFFTIEIAKLLMGEGKVIAADLQQGMLDKVRQKIYGTALAQSIQLHKCEEKSIGITVKVDFVLAFYVIHEVANQDQLFRELKSILKPDGMILIIEPKFHVPKKTFEKMLDNIKSIGFSIKDKPKVFFSRSILLTNNE